MYEENAAAMTDTPSLAGGFIGRVRYGVLSLKRFRMLYVRGSLVHCRLVLSYNTQVTHCSHH